MLVISIFFSLLLLNMLQTTAFMLLLTTADLIRSVLTVDFPVTLVAGGHTLVTALTHELVHPALFTRLLCSCTKRTDKVSTLVTMLTNELVHPALFIELLCSCKKWHGKVSTLVTALTHELAHQALFIKLLFSCTKWHGKGSTLVTTLTKWTGPSSTFHQALV